MKHIGATKFISWHGRAHKDRCSELAFEKCPEPCHQVVNCRVYAVRTCVSIDRCPHAIPTAIPRNKRIMHNLHLDFGLSIWARDYRGALRAVRTYIVAVRKCKRVRKFLWQVGPPWLNQRILLQPVAWVRIHEVGSSIFESFLRD